MLTTEIGFGVPSAKISGPWEKSVMILPVHGPPGKTHVFSFLILVQDTVSNVGCIFEGFNQYFFVYLRSFDDFARIKSDTFCFAQTAI